MEAVLYYIKEITQKGDLYKIGVTWYDHKISLRDNITRRYTVFNNEIQKGLKFQIIDCWLLDKKEAIKRESEIKYNNKEYRYYGDESIIKHYSELFFIDVLELDSCSIRFTGDTPRPEPRHEPRPKTRLQITITYDSDTELGYPGDQIANIMV